MPRLAFLLAAASLPALARSAVAQSDDEPSISYASTVGAQHFADGHTQSGVGTVVRWHFAPGLAIGATPAWARVQNPASLGGGAASGLVDLPLELTADHALPGISGAVVGGALAMTLPVGDSARGFGAGRVGYGVSMGLGFAPARDLSVHLGAGRSLSDFSMQGALGGASGTWGDAEMSWRRTPALALTLGLDGDLTSGDTLVGRSSALVGGFTYDVGSLGAVTMNLTHGVSGSAARWGLSLGFGTDFAHLESLGSSSPVQRAMRALGGQSHGNGWGQGTNSGTTHGQSGGTHGPP